jgi:triphosphatase
MRLAVAPGDLERLFMGAPAEAGRSIEARLLSTEYYDTPRLDLLRRGMSLRIQHDGKGWMQGVMKDVAAAPHRRIESESRISRHVPDLARIADHDLAAPVRQAAGRARLKPVFRTQITRRRRLVSPAPGTTINMCFDRGTFSAGAGHETICQIELELEQGPAWRLFELALELEQQARVRVEPRSTTERGYALAGGGRANPVKAKPGAVAKSMTAIEAFVAISFGCLDHLNANREGMLAGGDVEYLHQMRVGLRRLRSAFSAFSRLLPRPAMVPPLAEIRWLSRALGPARDWDVFIAASCNPILAQLPGHHGLIAMQGACERCRAVVQRASHRAVASRRYQRLLLGVGAWLTSQSWSSLLALDAARALHQPVRQYALAALARRYRQVCRRGRRLARLQAAELHRLRVAVKKLRYAAMFFSPLFRGRQTAAMLAALEALQDTLGGIHDCVTATRLIEEARTHARGTLLREAQALLASWNDAALADHRRQLKTEWKALRAAGRFWERENPARAKRGQTKTGDPRWT